MKKLLITATAILCAFAISAKTINEYQRQKDWTENRETITITVQYGDTIDGYWAEYAPDWMGREEYREYIKTLNDMYDCAIYVGQTIQIYTMN